jgi:hypothetical protein
MTLLQLLKDCKSKNIVLSAEAGRLVVTAPVGGMEPELREALKAAKAELLSLVAAENPGAPCKACAPRSFGAVPLSPYQAPFWASFSEDGPAKAMPIIVEAFDFEVRVEPGVLQQALDWTVGAMTCSGRRLQRKGRPCAPGVCVSGNAACPAGPPGWSACVRAHAGRA